MTKTLSYQQLMSQPTRQHYSIAPTHQPLNNICNVPCRKCHNLLTNQPRNNVHNIPCRKCYNLPTNSLSRVIWDKQTFGEKTSREWMQRSVQAVIPSRVCHPERSEGSRSPDAEILRCAQDDRRAISESITSHSLPQTRSFATLRMTDVPERSEGITGSIPQSVSHEDWPYRPGAKQPPCPKCTLTDHNQPIMSHVANVPTKQSVIFHVANVSTKQPTIFCVPFVPSNQSVMFYVPFVPTNSFVTLRLTHEMVLYQNIAGPLDCDSRERNVVAIPCGRQVQLCLTWTFGETACHPERSEGSLRPTSEILRCAQDDRTTLYIHSQQPGEERSDEQSA